MRTLPSGTVTFLFTDIEGSTKLLHELGGDRYVEALTEHRRILREAFTAHGGIEVDTQGDAFFVAFPDAKEAVAATLRAQEALSGGLIAVRMGLHTGQPIVTDEGYVGDDVHRGARIAASAHGGQVVLSKETRELVGDAHFLTDLGEHRVQDFADPVWIFQLGDERFPPLKTISNTNLPRPASSFVGREREVGEVASLLGDGSRLVTLTGPGGTGKTRLAIESASEVLSAYRNGVFWVGLAPLRDPALVAVTISQTLGAKNGPAEHIGEREMLLVLDNFEQVVEAARELPTLLEACPNLRLLVTSRELLRVQGEVEYAVPPLADPEAIDLFCARSQLDADETIGGLCRRLDNLPLAIELAAARTKVLSPDQILVRLSQRLDLLKGGRDAEARQRTLRATIEWSHDLLDEQEKHLFARLSVFRGGCTLEAAEEVAEADLDTVQSLVEKSLLRSREDRFWMLETILEYAIERLDESGEGKKFRQRHAEHFLALAEEAYPNLKGSPGPWLDRLEHEHDNLRAALDELELAGETDLALQLAGGLYPFWYMRGHFIEGKRRLENLLAMDDRPATARVRALQGAAVMAANTGDIATGKRRAEEALTLSRDLGDAWGTAYSIFLLGFNATEEGDWARAHQLFDESRQAFRELGDDHYLLVATDGLAWTAGELGDNERRRALHEEVLRQARAQSNDTMVALQLDQLATFALEDARPQAAIAMLKESLRIYRHQARPHSIWENLTRFARALVDVGRAERAAQLLATADVLREDIGVATAWVSEMKEVTLAKVRTQLGEDTFTEAWEQGRKLTVDEAVELALSDA